MTRATPRDDPKPSGSRTKPLAVLLAVAAAIALSAGLGGVAWAQSSTTTTEPGGAGVIEDPDSPPEQDEGRGTTPRGDTATAGAPAGTTGPEAAERQLRANDDPAAVRRGEELFLTACINCHGVGGVGTPGYPSLVGVGAMSADFYLRTGRMPLSAPVVQPPEKPLAFSDDQIIDLVAYVASLGDGPPVPDADVKRGSLTEGANLYLANCAACHQAAAAGGALSGGRHAPDLLSVHPTQVAEAPRIGPGDMPVFNPQTLSDEELDSIARYITYLQEPEHPGGLRIGGIGPVPEGFVAWLAGLGLLLLVARWITRERHVRRPS